MLDGGKTGLWEGLTITPTLTPTPTTKSLLSSKLHRQRRHFFVVLVVYRENPGTKPERFLFFPAAASQNY